MLYLHAFKPLHAELDVDGQALDVPGTPADQPRKLALYHPKHVFLDATQRSLI